MACRCATVLPGQSSRPASLTHSFGFLICLFYRLSASVFFFPSLFLSFLCLPSSSSSSTNFFPRSFISLPSGAYSAVPLGSSGRHHPGFLHRGRSSDRPLNLRPINLDKLNERSPAFDARVNRRIPLFSSALPPKRDPSGPPCSPHTASLVLNLRDGRL